MRANAVKKFTIYGIDLRYHRYSRPERTGKYQRTRDGRAAGDSPALVRRAKEDVRMALISFFLAARVVEGRDR